MAGFTKSIRKNKISPKDGSEPLAVIEFSLTNEVRDSLKKALDAYMSGDETYSLGQIIKNHFPREVLDELGELNRRESSPATVYVVKNLPEIEDKQVPTYQKRRGKSDGLQDWLLEHSYAPIIGRGVAAALGLDIDKDDGVLPLLRHGSDGEEIDNGELHKHVERVTLLGVVRPDGSPTRFTDFKTLPEDSQADSIWVRVPGRTRLGNAEPTILQRITQLFNNWERPQEAVLLPEISDPSFKKQEENEAQFAACVARHSQDVVTEKGDLVLWSNKGRIWHCAMPPPEPHTKSGLTRVAFSMQGFER